MARNDISQRGNALIILLIIVALFAALTFAVTGTNRGGNENISEEKLSLAVAEMLQHASSIKENVLGQYLLNGIDQVKFADYPYNPSGTVYAPNGTTTTGVTTGLFNPQGGGMVKKPLPLVLTNMSNTNLFGWFYYYNLELRVNGESVGSDLGDEFLYQNSLTADACRYIQKALTGILPDTADLGVSTVGGSGSSDKRMTWLWQDGTQSGQSASFDYFDIPAIEGCFKRHSGYAYFKLIKAH